MSLLADYQIQRYAKLDGMIKPFEGRKLGSFATYGLSPFGYDIRLGSEVGIWIKSPEPLDPEIALQQQLMIRTIQSSCYVLQPGEFILAHSEEYIRMPKDVSALVKDKSTYARLGIAVQNTVLEPGWEGQITLELSNHNHRPVNIHVGRGIAQVMFFKGMPPYHVYGDDGTYQFQKGVTPPRRKP